MSRCAAMYRRTLPGTTTGRKIPNHPAAAAVGAAVVEDCSVYSDCYLLRGPGRDVTDPRADTRRGWVRGQKWGGWISC